MNGRWPRRRTDQGTHEGSPTVSPGNHRDYVYHRTAIIEDWSLSNTPTFYVIDHKGIIRHKWVGSPSDNKRSGMPDPKTMEAALSKLVADAE